MEKPADVIHLPRPKRPPDQEVVRVLEELLADAREGGLVGLTAAAHYGAAVYAYVGVGTLVNNPELGLASTTRLMKRFL